MSAWASLMLSEAATKTAWPTLYRGVFALADMFLSDAAPWLDQPQFQTGPIGVRVQQGPKLPPLKRPP